MKYQDDPENYMVNGTYVGVRLGGPLRDALAPDSDGYDHLREAKHIGTVLQDAIGPNPVPIDGEE